MESVSCCVFGFRFGLALDGRVAWCQDSGSAWPRVKPVAACRKAKVVTHLSSSFLGLWQANVVSSHGEDKSFDAVGLSKGVGSDALFPLQTGFGTQNGCPHG